MSEDDARLTKADIEPWLALNAEPLAWMARHGPGEKCYACGQEPNDPPHQLIHRFGGHLGHLVECEVTLQGEDS